MTIHTASQRIYKLMIAIGLLTALASCGGGGGGGGGPKKDATPDAFTFTAVANAAVNTEVTSALVTTTGFNQQVSISITGGTYSIGGGAFSNAAGTITNGQTVSVKVTSATSTNTPVEAVLTIGGVSGSFTVTTAPDITPDTFSFTAVTAVVPKSVNTSAAITVAGIDIAVPISITGGEYAIGAGDVYGAFTSVAGTVSKTQTVKVRGTASASTTTTTNVVLTISDKNATYAITTLADTVAPTAQILFPPPVSMTEGNTILVRGSAVDDYNTIASVKVKLVGSSTEISATTTDGFKNWQALIPLTDTTTYVIHPTENILTVLTEDSAGNKSSNATGIAIKQAPITTTSFPNTNNGFSSYPWAIVVDKSNGNNRVLMTDESTPRILSIDLATAERGVFANVDLHCRPRGISINSLSNHLYAACTNSIIYDFDLTDSSKFQTYSSPHSANMGLTVNAVNDAVKVTSINDSAVIITSNQTISNAHVLSDSSQSIPNALTPINQSWSGIAYDKDRNRYLISDYSQQAIFSVDVNTGERALFSSNATKSGDLFGPVSNAYLSGVAVDDVNHRLIVTEALSGKLFSVDLITGNRSLISSMTTENPFNKFLESYVVTIVDPSGYALLSDYTLNGVYAVDLVTGHRVVFSK